MDYRKTLNLPKTNFPMKADLSRREPEILEKWEKLNIYNLIRQKSREKPKYLLHDGPPYANGDIHMGHALNKILKDIIIKYKMVTGWDVPFIPGWDCHGLPIEYQLFKGLAISKNEIPQVEFRQKAKKYALKFVEIQKKQFKRLGVFGDWQHSYLTLSPEYEAKIVEIFGKLVERGYIYRGKKPVYWCSQCETALAEAEVEYANIVSPSIYVKFPLVNHRLPITDYLPAGDLPKRDRLPVHGEPVSVLIWTTTPWTLPANVAVAFHPEYEYAGVEIRKSPQSIVHSPQSQVGESKVEVLIVAKDLVDELMEKFGIKDYEIVKTIKGKDLEGIRCQHPLLNKESVGILADFVRLEEGTGVVHIAPGHGEEDYQVGLKYNLRVFAPVDEQGKFTSEAEDFVGMEVFSANEPIVANLKENGNLIFTEKTQHEYPHCWRCKKPIIFRATEQWFLNVDKNNLREKLLASLKNVQWIPPRGENRIREMISFRPDWCLSRQRFWGVPIPVFYCTRCNAPLVDSKIINSVKELFLKKGSDAWFNISSENILPSGTKCSKCGNNNFEKETDIIDVWFDSGVSHEAVLQNSRELSWPAELYLEGSDQHRGWFQSSLIPSVALRGKPPYRAVLTHGFVVDGEGRKMSKSRGNVIAPQEIIEKYGADILRSWVASQDYREDVRISEEILKRLVDEYRRIRNTFRFLLSNLYDFSPQTIIQYENLLEIDRWMLGKLQLLIKSVKDAYSNFNFQRVYQLVHNFCALELSSFYFDVLKDRLYTFAQDSTERRSSQTVLYEILDSLNKLIAPILAYTTEEVWAYLPETRASSIYLTSFPQVKSEWIDEGVQSRWEKILSIREEIYKILERARNAGLVNSFLEALVKLSSSDAQLTDLLNQYKSQWPMILIVSQVEIEEKSEIRNPKSENHLRSEAIPDLWIKVEHAKGKKCERCWNWSPTVGKNSEHPGLCSRCLKVIVS